VLPNLEGSFPLSRRTAQAKKGLYSYIDGGKKVNANGESEAEGAIGALLKEPNGQPIEGAELSRTIGRIPDPHSAEYQALLDGLELARGHTVDYIAVFSDSRTFVNQVNGLEEQGPPCPVSRPGSAGP
jgi:ribonuclease HI